MVSDGWRDTTIGELCDTGALHTQTGPFGSQLHKHDYVPQGTPVVPTEAIGKRLLKPITVPQVAPETADRLSRHRIKAGDILFARRGIQATGLSAIARPEHTDWICGTGAILLRVLDASIDPEFLSFVLSADSSFDWLRQHAVGAVMPNLNETVIRQFPLRLPAIETQRQISRVLRRFDDKVEMNRRTNGILERMARAIFKAWFVDFEPVKAKAAGATSFLGMPQPIFDQLPKQLVDSELGEIPYGWVVRPVEELCQYISSGGTPKRKENRYWDGGTIPWFKTGELLDDPLLDSAEHITELGLQESSCKLWQPRTVVFALYASPTVGRLGWLTRPATSNQAAAGLVAKDEVGMPFLLYTLLFSRSKLQQIAVGAAQQNINQHVLKSHRVIGPPSPVSKAFSEVVDPLLELRETLATESYYLASIRDTLLPKVISGELAVRAENGGRDG